MANIFQFGGRGGWGESGQRVVMLAPLVLTRSRPQAQGEEGGGASRAALALRPAVVAAAARRQDGQAQAEHGAQERRPEAAVVVTAAAATAARRHHRPARVAHPRGLGAATGARRTRTNCWH